MSRYGVLQQEVQDEEKIALSEVEHVPKKPFHREYPFVVLVIILSLALNLIWMSQAFFPSSRSDYELNGIVKLPYDVTKQVNYTSPYNDPNRTIEDEAWHSDDVFPPNFVIALEDSVSEGLELPYSMRWPWDDTKGIYVVTSGHQLHCLHMFRDTINEAVDQRPISWGERHLKHCLDYLLQNVMCQADDTLLYTGMLHANVYAEIPLAGLGTMRQCRNWNKLKEWSKSRSACYKSKHNDPTPQIDRYKFCPDGSKPWEDKV